MRSSVRRIFSATAIACAILLPHLAPRAQDAGPAATRPRRATSLTWPTTTPDEQVAPQVEPEPARITSEPVIRIGLAVNARRGTVSTAGHLLDASAHGVEPTPFEVSRIRVEPRSYPPTTAPTPDGDANALGVETTSTSTNNSQTNNSRRSSGGTNQKTSDAARDGQETSRQTKAASSSNVNSSSNVAPHSNATAPTSIV